jgi:predicted amidophosphoribosyltransferase
MPCKGICIRHKVVGRYANGHKRCQHCNLFIKWEELLCPCCGYKLRIGPRHSKFKAKFTEQKAKSKIVMIV